MPLVTNKNHFVIDIPNIGGGGVSVIDGTANTGGGAGRDSSSAFGKGGSGLVVVRYLPAVGGFWFLF